MTQYFLVQISKKGSKDLFVEKIYMNNDWSLKKQHRDQGLIEKGDFLIIYLTSKTEFYKKQIRFIYKIVDLNKKNTVLHLNYYRQIRPIYYDEISSLISDGYLGKSFKNIGQQGFNIIKITSMDYYFLKKRIIKDVSTEDFEKQMINLYEILSLKYNKLYLNTKSNYNMLIYYYDDLNQMPDSPRKKLENENLIKSTFKKGERVINLTKKGRELISKHQNSQ